MKKSQFTVLEAIMYIFWIGFVSNYIDVNIYTTLIILGIGIILIRVAIRIALPKLIKIDNNS